ncbi:MAG: exclusion suppressor FxsA [Gammaproteobacteria bacterium CG22_combo_CG10-13_8_21_14_all_40_8]|nr:MAG: exclusion suppressor FxsA [Gammaproteobacteria bacterium CG22_combo_CG10-13_8_21_14_all_40_8]
MRWLLLILLFPLIEISVFVNASHVIGVGWVMFLSVFSAVWGITLVKIQGIGTLGKFQQRLAQGEAPGVELLEGFFLLLAGFFLLIPGFITDSIGALLLIPPLRRFLATKMFKVPAGSMHNTTRQRVIVESIEVETQTETPTRSEPKKSSGRIIDQEKPWE